MYMRRTKGAKRDPIKQWRLPDRVFFACGACHVLAFAFLRTYPDSGFAPIWIQPTDGHTGNHIVVVRNDLAFDYHGYSDWPRLLSHMKRRAQHWSPGWDATLVPLPEDVLVSESKSRMYDGLWLKEPRQFLFDAMPRAEAYVQRFPAPRRRRSAQSSDQADGLSGTFAPVPDAELHFSRSVNQRRNSRN